MTDTPEPPTWYIGFAAVDPVRRTREMFTLYRDWTVRRDSDGTDMTAHFESTIAHYRAHRTIPEGPDRPHVSENAQPNAPPFRHIIPAGP